MLSSKTPLTTLKTLARGISCSLPRTGTQPERLKIPLTAEQNPECICVDIYPERADLVLAPFKNHQPPYQQLYCELEDKPLPIPQYVPCVCCLPEPCRRPRKVVSTSGGCQPDPVCGVPTIDRCLKLLSKNCAIARNPTRCFKLPPKITCVAIKTPTLSFHECLKDTIPPPPIVECRLSLADR